MPFYAYDCDACGEFSLWRGMAERNAPAYCPYCDASCQRLLTTPNLALMPAGRRKAFARNEKSRHEPAVHTRHQCGGGCGCGSGLKTPKTTRTVDLGKAGRFESPRKGKRPWMLGH